MGKKLTRAQVAERYSIKVTTVAIWQTKNRTFPKPIHVGRRALWDEEDLDAYDAACARHVKEENARRRELIGKEGADE